MSSAPQRVHCSVLGQDVVGTVVDDYLAADFRTGPRRWLTVDVQGHRYRVPADDAAPYTP